MCILISRETELTVEEYGFGFGTQIIHLTLVFTGDASSSANTNAINREDPSECEIRRKHNHKKNTPTIQNSLGKR